MTPYYEQDGITIYNADCRDILPTFPDKSFDLVLTDPPYGIELTTQRGLTEPIKGDGLEEARGLWRFSLTESKRVLRDNTQAIYFYRWSESDWTKTLCSEFFTVKDCIVWKKNVWGIGYYMRPQHEFAWYLHNGTPPVPEKPISNVWEVDRESAPIHSCQKPVALMIKALLFCGSQHILDPFMGSGTTLVAAKQLGRKAVGIEIEEKYCEIAVKRLAQMELFGNQKLYPEFRCGCGWCV